MKIAHISDVHIRLKDRHNEYREVFSKLYDELRFRNPDRIVLTGDIVHSKTTLSPELVSLAIEFLQNLSFIAPVDIIAGNHDMNMSNMDRMDSLTPIVDASMVNDSHSISYYTKTGLYEFCPGFVYGVYSLFDGGDIVLKSRDKEDGKVYIALYHGVVSGCKLDSDYVMGDSSTSVNTFDNFDFAMLGDIHKRQFLNDKCTIAYAGSLIQQNYSEDIEKGFLFWDIQSENDFECEFVRVYNDHAFATIYADESALPDLDLPSKTNIRVIWGTKSKDISKLEASKLNSLIKDKYNPLSIQLTFKPTDSFVFEKKSDYSNISNRNVQRELLREWLLKFGQNVDIDKILEIDDVVTDSVASNEFEDFSNEHWHLKKLSIDNFMSYDTETEIDFNSMRGIIGLFGNNASGKSVIIDSILYALFNKTTREVKNEDLINTYTNRDTCTVRLQLEIGGVDYEIKRWTTKQYQKISGNFINARTDVTLKRKVGNGDWENISETQRNDTEKIIRNAIGSYDDFMITTLSTQGGSTEFLKLKKSPRADILLRFLGLDIFNKKYEHSKNILKQIGQDISNDNKKVKIDLIDTKKRRKLELNVEISNLKDTISNLNLEIGLIRDKISENNKLINNTIKVDKDVETIQLEIDELNSEISELERLSREKTDELNTSRDRIYEFERLYLLEDSEVSKLKSLKSKGDEILDEIENRKIALASNNQILKIYDKDIKNGNGCPVSDDIRHKSCKFLCGYSEKKEKHEEISKIIGDLTLEVENLQREFSKLEHVYKKLKDHEMILNGIKEAKIKAERMASNISEMTNKIEVKNVSLRLLNSQLNISKSNSETIKNNREYKQKNEELSRSLSSKIKLVDEKNDLRENLRLELALIDKDIDDINSIIERISVEEKKYKLMNIYCDAMHRTGLPIDILKKYIPKINYEINKILGSIVDFEAFLNVEDGETDIDLVMKYNWGNGKTRPSIMCCGMEKMIMNMAIRCAILSVSNLNVSSSWYIDEGFGTLSPENRILMKKFFEAVHDKFRNILIISHLDELKDIVDYPIIIESSNGISKLNFQN